MKRRVFLAAFAATAAVPFAASATTAKHRRRGAWIEARKAIEAAGFSNLQGLDMEGGVWHATGQKDGKAWAIAYSRAAGVSAQPVK
jgi:hypothetical protein